MMFKSWGRAPETDRREPSIMRKLIIEKAAVRANMAVIKERARGAALYGVLTGDGGGAGLTELARLIRDEGISRFAVGTVEEAQALREAGFEDEEILMLRATVDREELERLVDLNVVCTISSVDTGLALNAVAENRSTVAEAHIQVDTGMGFGGFLVGEPEKILLAYRSLPNVALSGIYTQLHAVSPKGPEVGAQLRQFHQVLDAIHAAGFETGTVHAAGSYALMHFDEARLDAVRAGSVLLGRCRRDQGGRAAPCGLRRGPPGRSPLAAQGAHRGGGQAHRAEAAHPSGRPPGGLSKRLWCGPPPGLRPAGPLAAVAEKPEPHRPPGGTAGEDHRQHRRHGDHPQRHRREVLRRGYRRLRAGSPVCPGLPDRVPVTGSVRN